MKIHALARHPHLMEHLHAIHRHVHPSLRGEALLEFRPGRSHTKHWDRGDIVMVAGYPDVDAAGGRRVLYVEHGAGQRYIDCPNPLAAKHYHGSSHPPNVIGYISPRQEVADSWGRPAFAAGSPICDPYELFSTERVAALSFHWNGAPHTMVGVPEAGTAFDHYVEHLADVVDTLRAQGFEVVGHRHPQANFLRGFWEREFDIACVTPQEVRRRAQLLIADNTSMLYEMMYLGRDVIALNWPEARRDVEHGLRFWSLAPPVQANDADELIDIIEHLDDYRRRGDSFCNWDITEKVYGKSHSDGDDGARAARWITQFVSTI